VHSTCAEEVGQNSAWLGARCRTQHPTLTLHPTLAVVLN
jgi:hypothetical protein